jgi:hypothetical protein
MNNYYPHKAFFLRSLFLSFLIVSSIHLHAQQNVPVTGYNADHVADGIGAPTSSTSSTVGVDPGNYVFIDGTYQYNAGCALPTGNFLPANNLIASTAAPGLNYVLQPYTGNNALRVPATGVLAGSGLLTVTTPFSAGAVYLLSVAGGGAITNGITVTITFTDATTQVFSNRTAEDWCNTTGNTNYTKITTTNYNRIQAPTTTGCGNFAVCQYFAEMALPIDAANQNKLISSITVEKTTSTNVFNVYAVGMVPPCTVPASQPTALLANTISTGFISGSFTAPSPAPTGYLVVRYPQGATPVAPTNGVTYVTGQSLGSGTVVQLSSSTSFIASNLVPNTSYDFYVYSYSGSCAPSTANPTYLTAFPLSSTMQTAACGGNINGTLYVGPGGNYTDLTNALAAISSAGLSAATILELLPGYDGTNETYPISFQGNPCINPSLSITIRPSASNYLPLVISSNNATATIDLNGAKYITFDGRPGGAGTTKMLSIINTNNSGVAIRFSNDAISNTIMYCDVQGQNTNSTTGAASAQVGVISFWTANAQSLNGNDSNSILYCDVHATVSGFPAIGIASWGNSAASPVSAWNNNNTIDHCNIYDFFSASSASSAIKLDGGSHLFTITNNRIFQTAIRTYSSANNHRAFWLTPTATGASGFTVLNNFIGGNDSLGNGIYEMDGGAVATNFYAMDINHSGTIHTSVQGNTITSFSLTNSSTTANIFRGISTGNTGHVDIGNISGNIIGSTSLNGAITLSSNSSGSIAYGIINGSTSFSTDSIVIANNIIAGITTSSSTSTNGVSIHGIAVTSGSYNFITNNLVGSYTNNHSLYASNAATNVQAVYGISVVSGLYSNISGNTIVNLTNNYSSTSTATTAYTRGISLTSSTLSVVNNNVVRNMSSASISTGVNGTSALVGIAVNTSNPSTVIGNMIDSLALTNNTSSNATAVDGLLIGLNGSSPTHIISKNFVSNLMVQRIGTNNCIINGINILGGSNIVYNNMIHLGMQTDGSSYDTSVVIRGLYLNTTTSTNIYHNTVYLGGTNVLPNAKNTYAFIKGSTAGTTSKHELRNNIFVNERSNASSGGKHYQIYLNDITRISLSNNVYYGTGTGNIMGSFNNGASDIADITSGWTGYDTASAAGNPQFINPNGGNANSISPVNLHINPTIATPVEGAGILVSGVTDDYDGNLRSANTPVDIGADAGLFINISMTVDSTVVSQITTSMPVGATTQAIIAIKIYTNGNVNPLQATSFKLNTAGSSNASADIDNAKVYYTGGSSTFNTSTPFGSTVNSPSGTFYVNGTQTLTAGVNYFWVVYDTKNTATANNYVDARLDSVGLSGNANANILNGDPLGSRKISAPLNGNYFVGALQIYPTITEALADLALLGVGNDVTFTLTDADYSTNETFPIVISPFAGASTYTVTIRPDYNVTATIAANIANPVIRLDGVKNFVLDGRQGGITGAGKHLIIVNDNTAGSALNFINDASHNALLYTVFKGASTTVTNGVINFGPGVVTGNDSNLIDNCDIGDAASLPATLVQARGSIDNVSKFNTGNIISNCELFNFWHASGESNAFKISKGNAGWIIKGNSIYQTSPRTFTNIHYTFNWNRIVDDASNVNDMYAAASLSNMHLEGNFIGGSAAMCGGTPWTETNSSGSFCSYLNMGDSSMNYVKSNTFANFSISSSNAGTGAPGVWNAIQFIGGKLNIDSNLIGSSTDTASINITGANAGIVMPIVCTGGTAGTYSIIGNEFGGISYGGSGITSLNFFAIYLTGASNTVTYHVEDNHIGVQQIKALPSSSTTPQTNIGINTTSNANLHIKNNFIHNLYNEQSTTGTSQTIGIKSMGGLNIISDNTIDSLHNSTAQTGSGANSAVVGIYYGSTNGNALIEKNNIHRLTTLNETEATTVTGIYYAGGTGDVVAKNMIHSLGSLSTSETAAQTAIHTNGGTVRVQNNVIRLGIDAAGMPQISSPIITGILVSGGNARVFFNTAYIGGSGVIGSSNSYTFNRTSTGTDSLYNNILVNERSGITGNHYAIALTSNTNLKANQNLYYNPSGTTLGAYNNITSATMSDWKIASGVDGNSNSGYPSFINITGDMATFDFHITGATPVEGSGLMIAGITDDFDGDIRNNVTPTDIGADAGNFVLSDIFAPSISYSALTHDTVHTSLTLTNFATITDPSSVDVSTNSPRIYYKKKTDADVFSGNSAFDNGWKYVIATNSSSPFSFIIDYTIIYGGSISPLDTIQYFIAAQDILGNVTANPAAGFSAASVTTVFTAPAMPNYYRIKPNPLNGNYNVGAGQTAPHFTTLTSALATLNDVGIGSSVTFNLTDVNYSTNETFPLNINTVLGAASTRTVTIKPTLSGTIISGNSSSAIIKLNSASYVKIDGSISGNSRDLTISNTNTNGAVIHYVSSGVGAGCESDTISNVIISGSSITASNYGVFVGGPTLGSLASGNNHLVFINDSITFVNNGLVILGGTPANQNNKVINCAFGHTDPTRSLGNTAVSFTNNDYSIITHTNILNLTPVSTTQQAILIAGGTGDTVDYCSIANQNTANYYFAGIRFNNANNSVASNNRIDSIRYSGTSGYGTYGINVTGTSNNVTLRNNFITRILSDNDPASVVYMPLGIFLQGGNNHNVYYNSVWLSGNRQSNSYNNTRSACLAVTAGTGHNIRNNIFVNTQTTSNTNASNNYSVLIGIPVSALTINYNNYYANSTSSNITNSIGDVNGTLHATLTAWRTATAQDINSKSVVVNFTSNTDLHLIGSSNGNLNLIATPIAGLTTDIDGTTRNPLYPYMGADEASIPLPVKLNTFTAIANKNDVLVSWSTVSEMNNKGFDVERSVDGKNFEKVTFVKGIGNSNSLTAYRFTDMNAFKIASAEVLYYRLKQIDLNGATSYSNTVTVSANNDATTNAFEVYPNPFNHALQVEFISSTQTSVMVSLFDISGRNIMNKNIQAESGLNVFELKDLSSLDDGIYFISITQNGVSTVQKIIKN